ncbi:signal peptidase I [Thermobispora bispora]|uniref:signal peptidase I n=1 Tax=Thermobispora bispora TaxID=2006 RepID=UPI00197DE5BE|nr:signal peptidase I [Thermobispora bispora]QSI47615.1 signal peptidase I [Thermobispora bispora]
MANTEKKNKKLDKRGEAAGPSSGFRDTVLFAGIGLVIAILIHTFVLQSFYIPSESMQNTLQVNDRVIVNKLAYRFGPVQRGDIVVFKGWDGEDTIKRVIAVGGDRVKCCDAKGRITINGEPLDETEYLYPGDDPSQRRFDVKVPAGRLWLMGDHRSNSLDSRSHMERDDRYLGTVSEEDVIGRAFVRYWPPSRVSLLSRPDAFSAIR